MSPVSTNRRFNVLVSLVVAIAAAIAVFVVPATLNISSNTDAARRTDDLASCRSAFAAATDNARDKVLEAQGDILSAVGLAVVNAIQQNPVALGEVARTLTDNQRALEEAKADLEAASKARSEAILLSQENPDRFLDQCEAIQ